ncbi:MAG: Cna B-type domain-containing protein [Firmicutes bacterium]|nr:Cna B-type domain-containing protein [Bacillota bacterium]
MDATKRIVKLAVCLVFSAMLVFTLIPGLSHSTAYAKEGDVPAHEKTRTDNGDGTYKIELTVTGDADDVLENESHVNVVIVYDESSSMTMYNAPNSNTSRADHAEDAVYGLINGLIGYQNQGVDIYAAEVGFGPDSDTRTGWTDALTTIRNHYDQGTNDNGAIAGGNNPYHQYSSHNGTNWASALTRANNLINNLPTARASYPTFVILITDGGPTAGGTGGTAYPGANTPWTDFRSHYMAATTPAYNIQSRDNVTLYGIYAFGSDANLLDDLMYYSVNNAHRTVNGYSIATAQTNQYDFGRTDAADYYYGADSTDALLDAIDDIFNQIVEAMGITDVGISDGTTNQVTVSSGGTTSTVELLGVDEDSYQYWLEIPVNSENKFTRKLNINGQATDVVYTVTEGSDGKCTVSWTEGTTAKQVTVDGTLSPGKFKYEWTGANDLYDKDPPEAQLVDGAVEWELGDEIGTLLSGVTYSVTFDVYPSQTALDYKARLDNGEDYDDVVPAAAQKYFDEDGNLETNTTGKLTYSDSRLPDPGPKTSEFENPPAVTTESSSMTVDKEWEGAKPPTLQNGLDLDVIMDGDKENAFYTANLNSPDWETNFNISCGLIKDGKALDDAKGHDFSFAELGDEQYRWELHAPTVRPMIIDGADEPTILIKEDKDNGYDSTGKTTYTIDGSVYYVDEEVTALTATNHRRSNLNLTKVVEGEGADPDALFPFTMTINNSKAPAEEPTDDPEHNSDYWVWFSIRDADSNFVTTDAEVQNATQSGDYFYAKSGDEISVKMKAGWNLRFTNLPTETEYTFTEGSLSGYKFTSAELTSGEGSFNTDGQTATGTIDNYDAEVYEVTYTNEYASVDFTVKKVWEDGNNQDGIRPGKLDLTLNAPEGLEVPDPKITKSGKTWTYKWSGLPKYDDQNQEIEYTVSEDNVPEGYECTETTAKNGGTITNTHEVEKTEVGVKKNWEGPVGDEVTVTLYADGKKTDNVVKLNEGNEWSGTFEDLPKNKAGKAIKYSVEESGVAGVDADKYTTTIDKTTIDDIDIYTITNKYDPVPAASFIVGEKVLENWDGKLPTGKFFFTIEGTGFEPAEDEEAEPADEQEVPDTKAPAESQEAAGTDQDADAPDDEDAAADEDAVVDDESEDTNAEAGEVVVQDEPEATVESAPEIIEEETDEPEASAEEEADEPETVSVKSTKAAETEEADEEDVEIPLPDTTKVTNTASGKIAFGEIEFTKPGTYTYTITESGSMKNVTNDPESTRDVTIEVTADENGDLTAEIQGDEPYFTFTNTYEPPVDPGIVTIDPPVKKVIKGDAPKKAETYTFKLEAKEDANPMPNAANGSKSMTTTITGEGESEFGEIVFTENEVRDEPYMYRITEVPGTNKNCEYDDTVYFVKVTVSLDDEGKVKAKREYTKKSGEVVTSGTFTFVNTYKNPAPEPAPQTGDDSNILPAWIALITSALALAGLGLRRRREN